ncbi:tRNA (guanine(46)-N(7))-methyltransferase [hydrothermal vent metagenome]|uniref:tRNA (guanine(46)-N(7))-methyltransferase n=1 Tax=hydrothermal vent metagenome TaxID=652676 RepID=A0A3B0XZ07_9ZZZZ
MNDSKHNTDRQPRRIRSFVRREGRLTPGQQHALDKLWPRYGLDFDATLELQSGGNPARPVTLEIGFGNGDSLAQIAAADPDSLYIGIEVHRPGVGHLLKTLDVQNIRNVHIYCHDAVEILEQKIPDNSLDRVLLFFPDPWHKTKHHKRRIVRPDFVSLVARKLNSLDRVLLFFPDPWHKTKHHKRRIVRPDFVSLVARKLRKGGKFHLATDWKPYAEHMLKVMCAAPGFSNTSSTGDFVARPDYRPVTKFEQRGQRLGHGVYDLIFQCN